MEVLGEEDDDGGGGKGCESLLLLTMGLRLAFSNQPKRMERVFAAVIVVAAVCLHFNASDSCVAKMP
jgi:hypothetical protein